MAVHSLLVEFVAYRYDAPPITDDEFVTPLALVQGEYESAWSWKEHWGGAGVRIVTLKSDVPVEDSQFDQWASGAIGAIVHFLKSRPSGAFAQLRESGLVNLQIEMKVIYTGSFPIIDWPMDLYDTCKDLKIGLKSSWNLPEDATAPH